LSVVSVGAFSAITIQTFLIDKFLAALHTRALGALLHAFTGKGRRLPGKRNRQAATLLSVIHSNKGTETGSHPTCQQ